MKNVILVPTDFTDVCENAIQHAVRIADDLDFNVTVLHVINKESKAQLKKDGLSEDSIEKNLNNIKVKYQTPKVKVDYIAREGSIFSTISEVAEEIGANYVILGTHGKVGFKQQLLGSFALKVATSSKCPTIVVQKGVSAHGYENIVFPVDINSETRQKLVWTVHIAKHFKSKIHLFPRYESEPLRKNKVMAITKQIKNILEKNNVDFVDKVSDPKGGNYVEQIMEFSKSVKADLLVIMTEEQSLVPIPSFILSASDEEIIFNELEIPVMCVNPREVGITIVGL